MRLEAQLQLLPPRLRSAMVLRVQQGMPYPEVAAALGTSVRSARMYVFEARKRLAQSLAPLLDDETEDRR